MPGGAEADLQISNLTVFLNDLDITVQAVLLEAIPESFHESLKSGIPMEARFFVELWQYNRFLMDQRIKTRTIERQLAYNVLTKEYKVVSSGERREPYLTKELREAQRILSDLRGVKLAAAASLDPHELFYVRVRAEVSVGGANTFFARLFGDAEETPWTVSPLLTITLRQ
ncbi:MAG: DUF4390 domain-containing protein [Candidatus Methylomirabilia bacterium]